MGLVANDMPPKKARQPIATPPLRHGKTSPTTLFRSLPLEVLDGLRKVGRCHRYVDKQLIAQRGDRVRELNVVEVGAVRVSNLNLDGRRTETAVLEPGDSFGEFTLLAGTPRFFDFHAHGVTDIRTINKPQFDDLMQASAAFRDGILSILTHRLLMAVSTIEDMRSLPLPTQLAKFLLHRCEEQSDSRLQFHGTQSELADALGVSRVSLGQALATLKHAGLATTGYRCVHIPSKSLLHAWVLERASLLPV